LAKIVELHAEQFLPNSWQHTRNSHISQLIVWQIQRKAHALGFSEPSEEFHGCFIVPLPQGGKINPLFLTTASEVMSMKFLLQIFPGID
jgi:hypothetical protein